MRAQLDGSFELSATAWYVSSPASAVQLVFVFVLRYHARDSYFRGLGATTLLYRRDCVHGRNISGPTPADILAMAQLVSFCRRMRNLPLRNDCPDLHAGLARQTTSRRLVRTASCCATRATGVNVFRGR